MLKVNVDAAVGNINKGGVGVVIRDNLGQVMATTCWAIPFPLKAHETEVYAAYRGMKMAIESCFTNIILESDSMQVVKALKQGKINDSCFGSFIADSLYLIVASLSLSFSIILPTHFFLQPKIQTWFSPQQPNTLKVPTQASSLAHLSLSTPTPLSLSSNSINNKLSFILIISHNPLQSPFPLLPHRPFDPLGITALRCAAVVWSRNDLRVHNNETLNTAHNELHSILAIYCFDPSNYGKFSSGFDKTGPFCANFLIQSVSNLRKNLQERGSDLVVRVGKPEIIFVEIVKVVGVVSKKLLLNKLIIVVVFLYVFFSIVAIDSVGGL
ncbi:uncharacterized protein [Arachis hypogaea]|uniref:uncharacterized protein n=1 Tax=Arachis hypogaea TaxID=3818 RepID=UPI000DEC7D9E|nr:uncharacterized protein LOC112749268 [Arachis hypogaea]